MVSRRLLVSRPTIFVLCAAAWITSISTCGRKHDDDESQPGESTSLADKPMDLETKRWWIGKANRAMRLDQPLSEIASLEDLQVLEPKDIAAKLTSDAAFYDMMADFTAYWLGTKPSGVFEIGRTFRADSTDYKSDEIRIISEQLASQPQVIHAVKMMANGSDFWSSLFQEKGPLVFNGLERPSYYAEGADVPSDVRKSPNKFRIYIRDALMPILTADIQLLSDGKHDDFCKAWEHFPYYNFGGPKVPGQFFSTTLLSPFPFSFFVLDHCQTHNDALIDDAKTLKTLLEMKERLNTVVDFLNKNSFEDKYNNSQPLAVSHVTDVKDLDVTEAGELKETSLYDASLFNGIQNSSTNRNRRRASWVLKRFFCDDLTPLNVDAPSTHVGGQHGSDPACYSCHYKLDPMAGYFRELGNSGKSFADAPTILFDDGATANRATYEKPWKAAPETGREWNVGYIRSITDDSKNTFGSNFKDLLELLKTAPEVKECFVRRAFEYVVGEEQAFDRDWARRVTDKMNETAKTNSTQAIKDMFADVITSQAFRSRERNNNVCYDFAPGVDTKNRAPCRIATILERSCTSCHNATNRQGGLDLSAWKQLNDQTIGFAHAHADGSDVTAKETFQMMADRINSSDTAIRMPLMKTMPAPEREELFLWLQKEIAKK